MYFFFFVNNFMMYVHVYGMILIYCFPVKNYIFDFCLKNIEGS